MSNSRKNLPGKRIPASPRATRSRRAPASTAAVAEADVLPLRPSADAAHSSAHAAELLPLCAQRSPVFERFSHAETPVRQPVRITSDLQLGETGLGLLSSSPPPLPLASAHPENFDALSFQPPVANESDMIITKRVRRRVLSVSQRLTQASSPEPAPATSHARPDPPLHLAAASVHEPELVLDMQPVVFGDPAAIADMEQIESRSFQPKQRLTHMRTLLSHPPRPSSPTAPAFFASLAQAVGESVEDFRGFLGASLPR
jgi:hypothetical protein